MLARSLAYDLFWPDSLLNYMPGIDTDAKDSISLDIPGVEKNQIDILQEDKYLIIKTKEEFSKDTRNYNLRVAIGARREVERAVLKNGVLTISLRRVEEAFKTITVE